MENKIIESIDKSLSSQADKLVEFFDKEGFDKIVEAGKHLSVPHKGNSEEFFDKYVLHAQEFPLPDSKYYQSITEMQARIQGLVSRVHDYKNLLLDIEDIELQIEEIKNDSSLSEKRKNIQIRRFENDITTKQFSVGFIRSDIQESYGEFIAWKNLADKYASKAKLKSYHESRMAGMEVKKHLIAMKYLGSDGKVHAELAQGGEVPLLVQFDQMVDGIIESSNHELLKPYKNKIETLPKKKLEIVK